MRRAENAPPTLELQAEACEKNIGGLIMYYYILGCGIACVVLFGINSMDTVDVRPAEILGKVILWPVALMEAVVRYSSTHHNIKTAL